MKKTLLLTFAGFLSTFGFAINATDFTATDCASTSHNLFTELAAGKVVVMTWVMPCSACIGSASTASSTVAAMGNPNVVFYLIDDAGNTSCSTLNSWATTNSITYNASFGNAGNLINMTDYGTSGMPKTVVIGPSGFVSFNVNGTISQTALQTAINNSLTGINEPTKVNLGLNVFPNPSSATTAKINFTLSKSADVTIEVVNELGQKISTVSLGNQSAGKQEYQINLESLSAGVYFVKLNAGETRETTKLSITK